MAAYPYIDFALTISSWSVVGEAFVDTGFDGAFIIPRDAGRYIPSDSHRETLRVADGFAYDAETWEAVLDLDERSFPVMAHAFGREYIIGREVLDQMEVCFEFGRRVRLRFE
jgi:predicted aspartyl protease